MGYTQILRRMTEGGVVLIDGATGTELEKRGADMNDDAWCGPANISHRGMLEEVHQDYIYAGAEIIITNTFATTRLMLEPAGFADRIEQVYRSACAAAIKARERVSGEHGHSDVLVAGSLSHMVPMTSIGSESADPYSGVGREKFCAALHEAAGLLKDGGCDLLMLEMMYHPQRFQCALEAALSTGLPVWAGFSARWGENGEVLSYFPEEDIPLEEVIALLPRKGADAAGIMHSNVDITGPALEILGRYFTGPRYAYPDSGFFRMPHWQFEDIISPADLTAYAVDWIADGVSAVGGCCGLSVEHIEALSTLKH
ncbi:MAG: homocysteine S-methyltransferase family protein [Spirochaetia bacterium]|nr:homocysteine S-methyltransferase family protein [Spirochaetia bacterium]